MITVWSIVSYSYFYAELLYASHIIAHGTLQYQHSFAQYPCFSFQSFLKRLYLLKLIIIWYLKSQKVPWINDSKNLFFFFKK